MITKIIIDMRFFLFVRASSCPVYASLQEGLNIHPPLPKQVLGISVVGYGFCLYLLFQVDILEDPRVPDEIKSNYGTVLAVFLVLFGALNGLVAVGISPGTRRMTIDKTTNPRLSFHLVESIPQQLGLRRPERLQAQRPVHLRLRLVLCHQHHHPPQPPHRADGRQVKKKSRLC